MTWQTVRDVVIEWCAQPPLVLHERHDDDGSTLRVTGLGPHAVNVDVVIPAADPAGLTIGHLWATEDVLATLPGATRSDRLATLGAIAADVALARPGRLTCSVQSDDDASQVAILCPVDEDGLTRQVFLAALADVGKARRQIERYLEAIATVDATAGATRSAPIDATDSAPAGATEAAAGDEASAMPTTQLAAVQPEAPWLPTHWVPPPGWPAWQQDGGDTATVQLDAGLPIRLLQRSGDWAQVETANGWTGWVDGRRLRD
ncbi:MAG: hypothetical protein JWM05_3623 [Acidimicrobiales bacterium]|nr:hypothetical protein [Acidimicrobiales bacterium]